MPRLADSSDDEETSLLARGSHRARRLWAGFVDFAMQGNILEIAFGLMLVTSPTNLSCSLSPSPFFFFLHIVADHDTRRLNFFD